MGYTVPLEFTLAQRRIASFQFANGEGVNPVACVARRLARVGLAPTEVVDEKEVPHCMQNVSDMKLLEFCCLTTARQGL